MDDQDEQDNQDWNAFEDAQASKKDAIAEARYDDFMRAVIDGDKEALQAIADEAWEFAPTDTEDKDLDDCWDVSLWDFTPTAPRFPTEKDAPRFQTLSELWREAHPNVFKDEDEDEEWISNTTPTEADEVIPHYTIPMPYPEDLEFEEMGYVDEDLDIGWRYYPTQDGDIVAIAPSKRAFIAYISGALIGRRVGVIQVIWRSYTCVAYFDTQD